MSKQIFKNPIPIDSLFSLLDTICTKEENKYVFNNNSYKKGIFENSIPPFIESCRPYYHNSKQKYLDKKLTYNSFSSYFVSYGGFFTFCGVIIIIVDIIIIIIIIIMNSLYLHQVQAIIWVLDNYIVA